MNPFPVNNYYKKVLRIALPAIAGLSTQMVLSLVDTAMVGRLPEATFALAAMGLGVLATWALISFFSSLGKNWGLNQNNIIMNQTVFFSNRCI